MKVGIPKEIKKGECRVGITPSGVREFVSAGHQVFVEKEAGVASGFSNELYVGAGATLVPQSDVWACDMVMKVKEPLKEEYAFFREGLILYTYLHLAAEGELTNALVKAKVTAVAYETLEDGGFLPLLRPMSEIAGRRAVFLAAQFLETIHGGKGKLISGSPGVDPATVTVVGGGVAGYNAAIVAAGIGANVILIERIETKIRDLYNIVPKNITILKANEQSIYESVIKSDVVISTVLVPGAKAPKVVREYMVKEMEKGGVIIDISIDQGGSVETVDRVTYHDDPIYIKHGVIHYSVGNMPGATPITSTIALTNATLSYGIALASEGLEIFKNSKPLQTGLNTFKGYVVNKAVAQSLDLKYKAIKELL